MSKVLTIFLALALLLVTPVHASRVNLGGGFSGGNFSIGVSSIKEQRFKTIYKQQYDFSCGSATLASLLSFHYDDVIDEFNVFKDMFSNGNQEKIQKHGFSLLDMKHYLSRRGYRSNGFKITLKQLAKAEIPAITIINNKGYMHFVIIKGSDEKEVLVGDPAIGIKVYSRAEFQKMWNNQILFVIQDKKDTASNHYQSQEEWKLRVKAHLGLAVDHSSLALFDMFKPSAIDF
ncbi:C39 family peptidase [Colwellia ponticola]|uniref:Peptidase C39 n=1 Tax=Colwellia ponticola TaxID=2304625 RepID=A0A8H2PLH4_9GAMM|nr:C39 family peptidase [Colwellia ponticola]TMM44758.1 peptidase C39 [Colwellia ponticola]